MTEELRLAVWLAIAVSVLIVGMIATRPPPLTAYIEHADGSRTDLSRYAVRDGFDFTRANGGSGLLIEAPDTITFERSRRF